MIDIEQKIKIDKKYSKLNVIIPEYLQLDWEPCNKITSPPDGTIVWVSRDRGTNWHKRVLIDVLGLIEDEFYTKDKYGNYEPEWNLCLKPKGSLSRLEFNKIKMKKPYAIEP